MSVPPYLFGAATLYLFALSSDHHKERGYHVIGGLSIALIGLVITVLGSATTVKYAGLCILLSGSYVPGPLTAAWLSGNTPGRYSTTSNKNLLTLPDVGKRTLVLGVNGFGNLAGVIGGQLYKHRYAPHYRLPFYVTLGLVATALLGYTAYRFTLQAVNARRKDILASKTAAEIEEERVNNTRYADRKWTFTYGL
jgi:hypothetical protein